MRRLKKHALEQRIISNICAEVGTVTVFVETVGMADLEIHLLDSMIQVSTKTNRRGLLEGYLPIQPQNIYRMNPPSWCGSEK